MFYFPVLTVREFLIFWHKFCNSHAIISPAAWAVSFRVLRSQQSGLPALQIQQKANPTQGCCLSWVSFDVSTSRNTQNSNILHHKVWLLGNCSAVKCTPSLSPLWQLIQMKQVARNRALCLWRMRGILMASGRMLSDANADFLLCFVIACWWSGAALLTLSRTIFSLSALFQRVLTDELFFIIIRI